MSVSVVSFEFPLQITTPRFTSALQAWLGFVMVIRVVQFRIRWTGPPQPRDAVTACEKLRHGIVGRILLKNRLSLRPLWGFYSIFPAVVCGEGQGETSVSKKTVVEHGGGALEPQGCFDRREFV